MDNSLIASCDRGWRIWLRNNGSKPVKSIPLRHGPDAMFRERFWVDVEALLLQEKSKIVLGQLCGGKVLVRAQARLRP